MDYEKSIKNRIKNNLEHRSGDSNLDQSHINNLVDECVTVDESYPIYNIAVTQFDAQSRKPSNIKVEFDIASGFTLLAQAGLLTGEPLGVFASVNALCALVSKKTKIDLDPETGFVYWVAYENQHDPWEVPKEELVKLASNKSKSLDISIKLTEEEVEYHIRQLCHYKSFKSEYKHGKEYLILRERCSADWS